MHARARFTAWLSLSSLALLAGCGPGTAEPGRDPATIVSVSPGQIDVQTGGELGSVVVRVDLSADPRDAGQRVCGASNADFPVVEVGIHIPSPFPIGSTLDGKSWDVTFAPDPNLAVGEHSGSLEVFLSSDPDCELPDGASRQIEYRVSKLSAFAEPAPVTLSVTPETTVDALRGSARIEVAAGPQYAWTARSLTPWLVLDTAAGLTGSDVQFHVDPALVPTLFRNVMSESGAIEITAETEGMTGRTVRVSLQLAVPVAQLAMPADQPAGAARRFRVRGLRFTEDAIAGGQLTVEGVPGAVFTRLGALDLTVELPAGLSPGTYQIVTPNALGLTPSTAVLRLTAAVETARAVLPGDGAGGQLLWDGARSALLVLERPSSVSQQSSSTLRRHAVRDAAWTTTSRAVNMVRRIGLSPGGRYLVGTSDAGSWSVFDPERLVSAGNYWLPSTLVPEPASQAPFAVTADGRGWSGTNNALVTFDLVRGGPMATITPTVWTTTLSEPARTMASRDGGRLLVSRPRSGAFLYHDATEPLRWDAFHANPAGATIFDAISDDGGRVLSGVNVYDRDFAWLGRLPGSAILSGDGRRAFTLAQRSDWRTGGPAPLIHVFDLTAPADGSGALPELGTVDLLDHDTCAPEERLCAPTSTLTVTPDGRVLFAQTDGGVVVVPIPEGLTAP